MGRLGTSVRLALAALVLLAMAGCVARYQNHGYVPRDDELERVVVGESTRDTVAEEIGRPSSTGLLTGGAWYYVGSRFRLYGGREPQEIERRRLTQDPVPDYLYAWLRGNPYSNNGRSNGIPASLAACTSPPTPAR